MLVVVKVPVDFADALVLDDPELTVGLLDQSGIVTHQNNSCRGRGERVKHAYRC